MKEEGKKIDEVLESGDFTIIYWDRGVATLYDKKWNKEEEFERDEYETMNKFIVFEMDTENGYCPNIVSLLAEQLGGKTDSI